MADNKDKKETKKPKVDDTEKMIAVKGKRSGTYNVGNTVYNVGQGIETEMPMFLAKRLMKLDPPVVELA